eukprot:Sdes_comp15770_c0_seq2m4832
MVIGNENVFEVGCHLRNSSIGSKNLFEVNSQVLFSPNIGSNNIFGIKTIVKEDSTLCNTIIHGPRSLRRPRSNVSLENKMLHLEQVTSLKKILPAFHRIKTP